MTVRDDAVCASVGLERDLHSKEHVRIKELVLGLQDTVRQLQSTIDAQDAVLKRLAAVVDRLSASPPAPAAMSATTASSAASAPAASAAAGAPTAVGTVPAQAAVTAAGTVPAAEWQRPASWGGVKPTASCYDCRRTTSICSHALWDENHRIGCLRNQGWYKARSSKHWRCPSCVRPTEAPVPWPVLCSQSHGVSTWPMPPPPPSQPWGSPAAAPPPLAGAQPAAQVW